MIIGYNYTEKEETILNNIAEEVYELGLVLRQEIEKNSFSIAKKDIANPMFFFDIKEIGKEYTGTVYFKAVNVGIFTSKQIKGALEIVNEHLLNQDKGEF